MHDNYLCECRLSSPRATDGFVEKALYTSGGRNTGTDRKDGAFYLGVQMLTICRAVHKTKLIGRNWLFGSFPRDCYAFAHNDIISCECARVDFIGEKCMNCEMIAKLILHALGRAFLLSFLR